MKTRVNKQWWACFPFVVGARRVAFDTWGMIRSKQVQKALEMKYRSCMKHTCDLALRALFEREKS